MVNPNNHEREIRVRLNEVRKVGNDGALRTSDTIIVVPKGMTGTLIGTEVTAAKTSSYGPRVMAMVTWDAVSVVSPANGDESKPVCEVGEQSRRTLANWEDVGVSFEVLDVVDVRKVQ